MTAHPVALHESRAFGHHKASLVIIRDHSLSLVTVHDTAKVVLKNCVNFDFVQENP
jgi:hypothetical protein